MRPCNQANTQQALKVWLSRFSDGLDMLMANDRVWHELRDFRRLGGMQLCRLKVPEFVKCRLNRVA